MIHFMGTCTYTMVRDGCSGGMPAQKPTFEIQQTLWNKPGSRNKRVTYVKEIRLIYGDDVSKNGGIINK